MRQRRTSSQITERAGSLVVITPYSADFVASLKTSVPSQARKFDPLQKAWIITPNYGACVAQLIRKHFGHSVNLPLLSVKSASVTRIVKLEYLGLPKDRGGDEPTSFGWIDGGWNLIVGLSALKKFFADESKPGDFTTLYAVLGVPNAADNAQIKTAYRRAARTYHPDVNKEPDAAEQFRRVQEAYELLADSDKRARYDAGLKLQAMTSRDGLPFNPDANGTYRPPLRCGTLLVEGALELGRIVVSKIHSWDDITDAQGHVMVSYWPRGGDRFEVRWQ